MKELAFSFLQKLSQLAGESVNMGILDSNEALIVAQVEISRRFRISEPVGSRLLLYATTLDKISQELGYIKRN